MKNWSLKAAVYENGLTQRELAEAAKMPEVDLSKVITGRKEPSAELQARIAKVLGVPVGDLFPVQQ